MMFRLVPDAIFSAMDEHNLDVATLAKKANVAPNTIYRAARGNTIRFGSYRRICAALHLKPNFKNFNLNGGMQNG